MANRGGWGNRSFRGGKGEEEAHTFPAGEEGSVKGLRGFLPPSADTAVRGSYGLRHSCGGMPITSDGEVPLSPYKSHSDSLR